MGKKAPAAPDPAATAKAQGTANLETAIAQGYLSNPNIVSPYGNVTSQQTGSVNVGGQNVPQFTQTTTLSPEQQKQFDMTNALQSQALGIGGGVLNNVQNATSSPFTLNGLPKAPTSGDFTADRDKATQAIIQRNQPQMDRSSNALDSKLYNQGIMPGSEAYKNAHDDLGRQINDFNLAAVNAGGAEQSRLFGLDSQARQQAIQEQSLLRSQPINEYATLLGLGGNVQAPQFNYQSGQVAPTDVVGPTNTAYSGKLAGFNAQQGLYGNLLGAGGSLGAAYLLSDVRLKKDIHFVEMKDNIPIYDFKYLNDDIAVHRGVIAQDIAELHPDAVVDVAGYLWVDYSKLGIEPMRM